MFRSKIAPSLMSQLEFIPRAITRLMKRSKNMCGFIFMTCVAFCSYWEDNRRSKSRLLTQLLCPASMMDLRPEDNFCDTTPTKFRNNFSHSNERSVVLFYHDPFSLKSASCFQGSFFVAHNWGLFLSQNNENLSMS
jgi:hypothetical protein